MRFAITTGSMMREICKLSSRLLGALRYARPPRPSESVSRHRVVSLTGHLSTPFDAPSPLKRLNLSPERNRVHREKTNYHGFYKPPVRWRGRRSLVCILFRLGIRKRRALVHVLSKSYSMPQHLDSQAEGKRGAHTSTTSLLQPSEKPGANDRTENSAKGWGVSLRFINHDAKTLGTENFLPEINTHIQKYSWRHVRRHKTRNLKWHQKNTLSALTVRPLRASSPKDGKVELEQLWSGQIPSDAVMARVQSPELNIGSIGTSLDPFRILVSDDCPWMAEALDYCMKMLPPKLQWVTGLGC